MAISDYLNKLIQLKNDLVANLNAKNVTATTDEKFNTLVPKVLEITSVPTVTEYQITGEIYGMHDIEKIRVDISSIPNCENLTLWENLFVFLVKECLNSVSSNGLSEETTSERIGNRIVLTSKCKKWYSSIVMGGSSTWNVDKAFVFKVYVIS